MSYESPNSALAVQTGINRSVTQQKVQVQFTSGCESSAPGPAEQSL